MKSVIYVYGCAAVWSRIKTLANDFTEIQVGKRIPLVCNVDRNVLNTEPPKLDNKNCSSHFGILNH